MGFQVWCTLIVGIHLVIHVTHHHVDLMQYVQEKEMLDLVNAYQSTLEILTPYVA